VTVYSRSVKWSPLVLVTEVQGSASIDELATNGDVPFLGCDK